jgi:hypothetical protein
VRLLRRDAGALRVGDALVDRERRGLALEGERDRAFRVDRPGVEQVEVARRRGAGGEAVGVGQAGGAVLGGEAGDVPRRAHRLLDRRGEKSELLALPRRCPE